MEILKLLVTNCCSAVIFFLTYFAFPSFCSAQPQLKASVNTVTNFDKDGHQITRFSTVGDAIDAHDGEIALFNGVYYLYGTSYDCGFEWGNKSAPFCGFKCYSSTDMVNWTDCGYLFDAQTPVWQARCNGNTYGCFRPHVIYNQNSGSYVLWINVYDNVSGYRVFTSKKPTGPFTEVAEPKLAVNSDAPAAGLNNGDHDTFVDDDGTAYLAYTDWRSKGTIVIEKLSADYLTGTGEVVKGITKGDTEAPGMFKRNGIYYVVFSDPNCGYCSGTGASYCTAASPMGPWSASKKISENSCGGQPSFVSTVKLGNGPVFLFGSDLWNNAAKNEALANYYWAPLLFEQDGSIKPITCEQTFKIEPANNITEVKIKSKLYRTGKDISKAIQRAQGFKASSNGVLTTLRFTTFKTGYPDSGLEISIYMADHTGKPTGNALSSTIIEAKMVGWSAKSLTIQPNVRLVAGCSYCIVIKSASVTGAYGFAFQDLQNAPGNTFYSNDGGNTFIAEKEKVLKFDAFNVNNRSLIR